MDHKGVHYLIRQGIERGQWILVVHLPQGRTVEKMIHGGRPMAEAAACDIIDKWLEKTSRQRARASRASRPSSR